MTWCFCTFSMLIFWSPLSINLNCLKNTLHKTIVHLHSLIGKVKAQWNISTEADKNCNIIIKFKPDARFHVGP